MVFEPPIGWPNTVPSTLAPSNQTPSPEATAETQPAEAHVEVGKEDVQQLIRKTDDASKLRQPVTTSGKLPDKQLAKFPKPKDPSPLSPPARRKSQRRSQGSVKSVKSPTKTSTKDSLLPAQARLPSNSRPKRTKSKKSRRRPRAPARPSSVWQLTESAKDLFTIRIFHRIEVDEMLPESTLREIRMSRAARWTRSPELGVTHVHKKSAASTPIEPLSLDEPVGAATGDDAATPRASVVNQGAGIDREGSKTPTAQAQEQGNGPAQGHEPAEQEPSLAVPQPDSPTTNIYDDKEEEEEDEGETLPIMIVADHELPTQAKPAGSPVQPAAPPIKPPLHRRLPSRQLPPLPTIPEIIATGPEQAALSPTSTPQPAESASKINRDDYVFLDSTPFTLTMPAFRHGQIRLAKADLPIGKLAAAVDDTLDWTAFQMAILGGAGDFFSEPTDYSRPCEAELDELDGVVSWFAGFGFRGPGALVGPPGGEPPPRTPIGPPWTPVWPRTPALSPPSPTSTSTSAFTTPNSSPRIVVPGSSSRSPGIRRIDPPAAPGDAAAAEVSDSIAARFFPEGPAGNGGTGDGSYSTTSSSKHRRSVSSTTFGPSLDIQSQQTTTTTTTTFGTQKSFASSRRNNNSSNNHHHVWLAIDSRRRPPSVDSVQSLPQSPMMDLVVSRDVDGNEYVVPMGFNLSHDLGDFLTWHAEHVVSGAAEAAAGGAGAGFGCGVPDGGAGLNSF
ncbi:hypothetical protein VTK56DRAFT_612 [Thermocarpiscus australiensis]